MFLVELSASAISGSAALADRVIYDYDDPGADPHAVSVRNINPYLVDAPPKAEPKRRKR